MPPKPVCPVALAEAEAVVLMAFPCMYAGDDAARIERRCHTKGERERKVNLKHRYRLPGSIPSGLSRPIPHRPIKSPAVVVATTKRVVLASAAVAVITRITVRVESTTV